MALTASWAIGAIGGGSCLHYADPDCHGRERLPRPITTPDMLKSPALWAVGVPLPIIPLPYLFHVV